MTPRARRPRRRQALALAAGLSAVAALPALVACEGGGLDRAARVAQAADSADQMMVGVRMYLTNLGVKQAELEADTAFVYEGTGITELRRIKITFFTVAGTQTSVLTADEGTYRGQRGLMDARGNVLVVRADGARLMTSALKYEQQQNKVSTDQAYTYVEGDRRVQGQGFVSDPTFSNVTTQGVRGTGGRFTLPGQ